MTLFGRDVRQIITYLAVGGSTALLELLLFQGLFQFTPLGAALANIIAVIVATACNFLLNGFVTFQTSSNLVRSVILYIALFLFNLAFSTTAVTWLISLGTFPLLAKFSTMACIVCWNFVLYKKVVFV